MLASNLVIYLEIGKESTIHCTKRKWIYFAPSFLEKHAK